VVELACKGLPNKVLAPWRRDIVAAGPAPACASEPGHFIRFAADEAAKRDFVLQTLMGDAARASRKRKHARIPVGAGGHVCGLATNPTPSRPSCARSASAAGLVLRPRSARHRHRCDCRYRPARRDRAHVHFWPGHLPRRPRPNRAEIHVSRGRRLAPLARIGSPFQTLVGFSGQVRTGAAYNADPF
jgi:hypothetical protein